MKPSRLMIVGCEGFLGSAFIRQARTRFELLGCGRSVASRHPDLSYRAATDLEAAVVEFAPEAVIFAAGSASVPKSLTDPVYDFQNNVAFVMRILEALRKLDRCGKFLMLSSAAVYGNPTSLPVSEDHMLAPISPYGHHKAMAENILRMYHQQFGIRTAALRIFSAFGEGLRRQVLWDLCRKCQAGPVVQVQGTGTESRDFIHAEDVAIAGLKVLENAPMRGETYNLANGTEVPIGELAQRILNGFPKPPELVFDGELPAGTPSRWCADIGQIRTLGFAPKVDFWSAIDRYVTWYRHDQGC